MPSIAQNRKKLEEAKANGTIAPIESPAYPAPPVPPSSQAVRAAPFLRAPIPSTFQIGPDSLLAFQKNNLPGSRIAPLPASLNTGIGASASSQTAPVAKVAASAQATADSLDVAPITTIAAAHNVNPTQTYFLMKGTLAPIVASPFSITTTTSSGTVGTSPSANFTRANGTVVSIGQTSQAISGLTESNFMVFPYWRESDQTLQFVKSTDVSIPSIVGVTFAAASSQYIETTTTGAIPTTFSVEMWVKGTAAGALFDYSAPATLGVGTASICQAFVTSAGEVSFNTQTGGVWTNVITAGAGVLDSTWHHVLIAYTNYLTGTATIFVDGCDTSDSVTFWTNTAMGGVATTTGSWHWGAVQGLAGAPKTSNLYNSFTISLIAIYDTALTAVEAGAHLNAYDTLGLSSYLQETVYNSAVNLWELNETSGTSAVDSVGTNTGTYENSPTLNQSSAVITVLGSPSIAWPFNAALPLQFQNSQGFTPLSAGGVMFSTLSTAKRGWSGGGSSGGSSGTGTGGIARGGGTCFSGNTLIRTTRGNVRIDQIEKGDRCLTAAGTWLPVSARVFHEAAPRKLHIMDESFVTWGHKILHNNQWVNAGTVFPIAVTVDLPVYTLTMESDEPMSEILSPRTERSFQLSNGIFAHNSVIVKEQN